MFAIEPFKAGNVRSPLRRHTAVFMVAFVVLGASGCGGGSTTGRASTTAPLSAQKLEALVVAPPSPYAHVPDQEKSTGLMEVGNPHAGTIGSPFGTKELLVAAGFQRGWESLFRTPTSDVAQIEVFEFGSAQGARDSVDRFRGHLPTSYQQFAVAGIPHSAGGAGLSPEGRRVVGIAFPRGRFAVSVLAGGNQPGFDYHGLAVGLANKELAALRSIR